MSQSSLAKTPDNFFREEARRSTRLERSVPLIVFGQNRTGEPFVERTVSTSVNLHGCRYPSRHDYGVGTWVTLQVVGLSVEPKPPAVRALVRSVHASQSTRELQQVGVELERPANVWGIVTPPQDWLRPGETTISMPLLSAIPAPSPEAPTNPVEATEPEEPPSPPESKLAEVATFPSPSPATVKLPATMLAEPTKPHRVVITPDGLIHALQGKLQQAAEKAVQSAVAKQVDDAAASAVQSAVATQVDQAVERSLQLALAKQIDQVAGKAAQSALAQQVNDAAANAVQSAVANQVDDAAEKAVQSALAKQADDAAENAVQSALAKQVDDAVANAVQSALAKQVDDAAANAVQSALAKQVDEAAEKAVQSALAKQVDDAVVNAVQSALAKQVDDAVRKALATIDDIRQSSVREMQQLLPARADLAAPSKDEISAAVASHWKEQMESYRAQAEQLATRLEKQAAELRQHLERSQEFLEKMNRELEPQVTSRINEALARATSDFDGAAARTVDRRYELLLESTQSILQEALLKLDARSAEVQAMVQGAVNSTLATLHRQAGSQMNVVLAETKERAASALSSLDAENRAACEARRQALEQEVARSAERSTDQFRKSMKAFLYSCLVAAVSAVDEHSKATLDGLTKDNGKSLEELQEANGSAKSDAPEILPASETDPFTH